MRRSMSRISVAAPGGRALATIVFLCLPGSSWLRAGELLKSAEVRQPEPTAQQTLSVGPWEIKVISFNTKPSVSTSVQGKTVSLSPVRPADRIAIVKVQGSATRGFTPDELAATTKALGDTGKFASLLMKTYGSRVFLSNHAFALVDHAKPQDLSASVCRVMVCGSGMIQSTTFGRDNAPNTCLGFLREAQFDATLFFAFRSEEKSPLLIFIPTGDEQLAGAALLQLGDAAGISVRYGQVQELVKIAQLEEKEPPEHPAAKEEPPRKEPPRPAPRPVGPEEGAKRLWTMAENLLANKAIAQAKGRLNEIVAKYPDSEYAKRAAAKLKELEE